ncbi:MAG TPA: hypothetical protein VEH31_06985 [Streptosporangiaceae bacterium]|nr:hypothetical protein [Streptosporangiaceae bacterium]
MDPPGRAGQASALCAERVSADGRARLAVTTPVTTGMAVAERPVIRRWRPGHHRLCPVLPRRSAAPCPLRAPEMLTHRLALQLT